jgi:BirA family transcriptional regulator, biotin operon repressor / biotin---[acetyl-CoA-carboxylase] ligase
MFDIQSFERNLRTQWLGANFLYREEAGSTNTEMKKIRSGELVHGTVLLADSQLKGRGQYDRSWYSEPGKNLTFTIGFRPGSPERLALLTLASGWAIIRAIQKRFGQQCSLQLPNDVLISGKKVAGILTENIFNGLKLDRMLIGIGFNVNQTEFPAGLERATSLQLLLQNPVPREELMCDLLESIEEAYQKWKKREPDLSHQVSRSISGYGEWVNILVNNRPEPEKVKFLGINEEGHLLILTKEFEVKKFTHEQIRIQPGD